jgi:hypothetical protein
MFPPRLPLPRSNTPPRQPIHCQGEWKPRMIPNPEFFEESRSVTPLRRVPAASAVAFELWTTDKGYTFDGLIVGAGGAAAEAAAAYRRDQWRARYREAVRPGVGGAGGPEGAERGARAARPSAAQIPVLGRPVTKQTGLGGLSQRHCHHPRTATVRRRRDGPPAAADFRRARARAVGDDGL